jgi:two-component system, NtrC family, nitrogen regulation sensor histidine kinase NtrY
LAGTGEAILSDTGERSGRSTVGPDGPGWLGLSIVITSLVSALATFLILGGMTPIEPTERTTLAAFSINILLVLALLYLVGRQALKLYRARRAGIAATQLHIRFVTIFAVIATVPVVVVAVVASVSLSRGLDPWFTGWTNSLMQNTVEIAHAYRDLQCRTLARETTLMAADLDRARVLYDADRAVFREFMQSRSIFLGFPVAMLVEPDGRIVERIDNVAVEGLAVPPLEDLADADDTEALCLVPAEGEILHAILRLPAHDGRVLVVTRFVDRRALDFPAEAEAGIAYYRLLEQISAAMQIAFAIMFAVIVVIVLLSAVWFGLSYANSLVGPIRRLINATQQVATGNFYVQVPIRRSEGDLAALSCTFNQMTAELRRQHDGLTAASELMDRRRRFTEAVLSGVSAGVIGIDSDGRVTIANPTAQRVFGLTEEEMLARPADDVLPELAGLISEARASRQRLMQQQITVSRRGRDRTLDVRLTTEQARGDDKGLVITLDDITDLVTAQRTSAWADVARRIAHEIKNPLTPIQLSAERIRRKYGKVITTDREVFDQCTDTIVRQVDDIKRMVDEFASFAQMPKPKIGNEDLADTVRQVVFMMRIGYPDIVFSDDIPQQHFVAGFDRRLISQALTNIIKNAAEAIAAVPPAELGEGRITVRLSSAEGKSVAIDVIDNGKGFPTENRARLLEPYMTTRDGGTGLGLAIVGKIFEEHGGGIELLDNPDGRGGWVRLWFPADADNHKKETHERASATQKRMAIP